MHSAMTFSWAMRLGDACEIAIRLRAFVVVDLGPNFSCGIGIG
jgi:hypothetical protein